jgi:hypothetical protein
MSHYDRPNAVIRARMRGAHGYGSNVGVTQTQHTHSAKEIPIKQRNSVGTNITHGKRYATGTLTNAKKNEDPGEKFHRGGIMILSMTLLFSGRWIRFEIVHGYTTQTSAYCLTCVKV